MYVVRGVFKTVKKCDVQGNILTNVKNVVYQAESVSRLAHNMGAIPAACASGSDFECVSMYESEWL